MPSIELRLRRHAIEIVGQLPESPRDALRVLLMARELVEAYLAPYDASAGTTPSLRAISNERPSGSLSSIQPTVSPRI